MEPQPPIDNPLIDYGAFQSGVERVGQVRENLRLTEREFLRMAQDPSTVILDARSAEKFALLHVKGAKNLSLPDITEEELAKIIPAEVDAHPHLLQQQLSRTSRGVSVKNLRASLNVYTMNVLFAYGYTNVYELGPALTSTSGSSSNHARSNRAGSPKSADDFNRLRALAPQRYSLACE